MQIKSTDEATKTSKMRLERGILYTSSVILGDLSTLKVLLHTEILSCLKYLEVELLN
jgi:hypothetical protein